MNFDLNIDNYTKDELADMFELPANYDKTIVEIKENKMRDGIINNRELNKDIQLKTINFLIQAKNILLNTSNNNNKQPIQNNNLQEKIEAFYNSSYELKPSTIEDPSEHMVQVRKEIPYLSSYPSEYFSGIINPLKKRTIKKNLNIDTRFRDNYYTSQPSNFNLTLPMNMNNVLTMQLTAIELPITYYNVSKQIGNNFFNITVDGVSKVVNIPDGNYSATGIINAINNSLFILGSGFQDITFMININNTGDGNNGSGQTMVGLSSGSTVTSFSINFQADRFGNDDRGTPLPLKLGWMLGFRNGIYINNLNYVSEGIADVTGSRYFYLVVDDHNNNVNNSFYSAFNSSILNKNILARISLMQTNNYSVLLENNLNLVTTPREYFGPVNLLNLNIQLLDEYGRIVDLNNMDYSFCLTLTTVYDI
uniref:Uncharacterized protein n=1 Tax=viral metagenome TaxID=1070528 RepID=A0A6C0ERP4_9ZZZZ